MTENGAKDALLGTMPPTACATECGKANIGSEEQRNRKYCGQNKQKSDLGTLLEV